MTGQRHVLLVISASSTPMLLIATTESRSCEEKGADTAMISNVLVCTLRRTTALPPPTVEGLRQQLSLHQRHNHMVAPYPLKTDTNSQIPSSISDRKLK